MATAERKAKFNLKQDEKGDLYEHIKNTSFLPKEINSFLESKGYRPTTQKCTAEELICRPDVSIEEVCNLNPLLKENLSKLSLHNEIAESIEIDIKYEGYIKREQMSAEKLKRLEYINLPTDMDYDSIMSLSTEARQKLSRAKPQTIGQASRIPGVSPNDISVLLILMGR